MHRVQCTHIAYCTEYVVRRWSWADWRLWCVRTAHEHTSLVLIEDINVKECDRNECSKQWKIDCTGNERTLLLDWQREQKINTCLNKNCIFYALNFIRIHSADPLVPLIWIFYQLRAKCRYFVAIKTDFNAFNFWCNLLKAGNLHFEISEWHGLSAAKFFRTFFYGRMFSNMYFIGAPQSIEASTNFFWILQFRGRYLWYLISLKYAIHILNCNYIRDASEASKSI